MDEDQKKLKRLRLTIILGMIAAIAIIGLVIWGGKQVAQVSELKEQNEQLQLANEQLQLSNEYEALNHEFSQYENQQQLLVNDSIVQKYTAAKAKVERLMQELKNEKTRNAQRIKELQNEITTLKGILRHYVAQIDSLGKENAGLRAENTEIKSQNRQLEARVQSESKKNETLTERMVLAEKLNVTGLMLTGLKKNGKPEKNITKAKQLMITFTIPQNNSTPVGEKTIYARITSPEGALLGNGGTFGFEGATLPCTAKKTIEYAGEEIGGITIYWDVNTALTPGDYTVELFADNYRLASRHFTMKK